MGVAFFYASKKELPDEISQPIWSGEPDTP